MENNDFGAMFWFAVIVLVEVLTVVRMSSNCLWIVIDEQDIEK